MKTRARYYVVLFTGSRDWDDRLSVGRVLKRLSDKHRTMHDPGGQLVVVQGGCRGLDMLAHDLALSHGIPCATFDAPWEYFERAAGPIRNGWMLHIMRPRRVEAFHKDIRYSRGTKNMIALAKRAGVKVRLHA